MMSTFMESVMAGIPADALQRKFDDVDFTNVPLDVVVQIFNHRKGLYVMDELKHYICPYCGHSLNKPCTFK